MGLTRAQRQPYRQTIAIDHRMDFARHAAGPSIDWRWFLVVQMPFRTRLSFTRETPRGLFGSIGLMAIHSWSASS
jgi:hypothetical protein